MENNKYANGKIYKITDIGYNECYYGSTIQQFSRRMGKHRSDYAHCKENGRKFIGSYQLFDKYGIENSKIELVENYPCSSKEELCKREGEYIRSNTCVHKMVAGRSSNQWREEHKDHKRNYDKTYRDAQIEEIKIKEDAKKKHTINTI